MKPMLAHSAQKDQLIPLIEDHTMHLQQKLDGQRIMVISQDNKLSILNRNGDPSTTTLPGRVLTELAGLPPGRWVLDCELVESKLWVFDLPESEFMNQTTFAWRTHVLTELFKAWKPNDPVHLLKTATTEGQKFSLASAVLIAGGEGVIAKRYDSEYQPGKRSKEMLKVKFYRDIDCVATELGRDGKRNIGLGVYDNGSLVDVGEVTALAGDGPNIKVGNVVCVKYLYAVDPNRPRLYQPTLPRLRDDKSAEQCTIDQLDNCYRNLTVLTSWG